MSRGGHAEDEAGQGVRIYQQTPAAGQQPSCNPVRHGSGLRAWQRRPETKQGQTSPKGYVRSQGSKKKVGPQAWVLGSPSLFFSSALVDIICRRSQITVRRTKAK